MLEFYSQSISFCIEYYNTTEVLFVAVKVNLCRVTRACESAREAVTENCGARLLNDLNGLKIYNTVSQGYSRGTRISGAYDVVPSGISPAFFTMPGGPII